MINQMIHGLIGIAMASCVYHFSGFALDKYTKHSYRENRIVPTKR